MIKVISVFGTRPEATKMAPLVKMLEKDERFESIVCVTGQHREQLNMVLDLFDINPDYNLDIMTHGQTVVDIMTRSMTGLDDILKKEEPDLVLVHGDTSTSAVAAQVAFLNKIKVGHVEAGLRSHDKYSPFPEEMNRRIISVIADLHFAPTEDNVINLKAEGIRDNIYVTGNTAIDAINLVKKDNYEFEDDFLKTLDFDNKRVITMTCHRRENWGRPMENIFEAVKELAQRYEDIEIVYAVHLNPMIGQLAQKILGEVKNVHLVPAMDYEPMANLMNKSHFILTDSGGLQEEAPALGKPVLVLRTETERPEAVKAGTVKVVGIEKESIVNECIDLLEDQEVYDAMANALNPFGDGKTSQKIIEALCDYFKIYNL